MAVASSPCQRVIVRLWHFATFAHIDSHRSRLRGEGAAPVSKDVNADNLDVLA
jgi:hypothetical protein